MDINWQELLPLLLVALAATYLAVRFLRSILGNKEAGCGDSCGGCSNAEGTDKNSLGTVRPFVAIEELTKSPPDAPEKARK